MALQSEVGPEGWTTHRPVENPPFSGTLLLGNYNVVRGIFRFAKGGLDFPIG